MKKFYNLGTCSQNRQSIKFQNHGNINFVTKLYMIRYILRSMFYNLYTRGSFLGNIQTIAKLGDK